MKLKNTFKNKHNIIALDKIQLNTPYALSYNPLKQYDGKVIRHDIIVDDFKKNLPTGWHYEYKVRFELSPKGRYHCHGIIYFTDWPVGFYSDIIPRILNLCTLEIDTIKDIVVWDEYMYKQKHAYKSRVEHDKCLDVQSKGYSDKAYSDNVPVDEDKLEESENNSEEESECDSEDDISDKE